MAKDQNGVIVVYQRADEFLALKAKIEEALAQHHAPSSASAPATSAEADPPEQLKKLADLHRDGLLTDEEFAAKRAVIVEKH